MNPLLEEIERELLAADAERPLSAESVRRWMKTTDLEAMGAVFTLLHEPQHYNRITPPLVFDDYRSFHLRYYEACFRENVDGKWCDSRYIAAHSLVRWFCGLWRDDSVPRVALDELKSLLARLYREGDADLKSAVVTGSLEHLFGDKNIRRFFADWKDDSELSSALQEALSYAQQIRDSDRDEVS